MTKKIILITLFSIMLVGIIFFISSNEVFGSPALENYRVIFYIDDSLYVPDIDFVRNQLPKYIDDMNVVLAHNTKIRLTFDNTDIYGFEDIPAYGATLTPMQTSGFDIWVNIYNTTRQISHGGSVSVADKNIGGHGVIKSLNWTKVFDPDTLTGGTNDMKDYWVQINHMLHELGHVFGVGISEYYTKNIMDDTTGVSPLANINIRANNPVEEETKQYWSNKQDWFGDVMMLNGYDLLEIGSPIDRPDLLNAVKFSNLSASIFNGTFRGLDPYPDMPDMDDLTLKVISQSTGKNLPNADVKIWKINSFSPYVATLLYDTKTDINGELSFSWTGASITNDFTCCHAVKNAQILIKISTVGYKDNAYWFTSFDAEEARIVNGNIKWIIDAQMQPTPEPTPEPPSDIEKELAYLKMKIEEHESRLGMLEQILQKIQKVILNVFQLS